MGDFDFDYWKGLAENDPAEFFRAREVALARCIALHPGQEKTLAEFQGHIDAVRVVAGSPAQASRALFGLIEDQLLLLGLKLRDLQRETENLQLTLRSESTV